MTHDFKAGDRAIVLPKGAANSCLSSFTIVEIIEETATAKGILYLVMCLESKVEQFFYSNQLAPLPITYFQLDAE